MLLECPNCRERVSFFRAFKTPAWGSFACKACGSILTISFGRRLLAALIWIVMVIVAGEWFGLYRWGRLVTYPAMAVSIFAVLYLFEKIIILDRRAFTCKECGYDLQGLPKARCPECGTAFDPSERQRILERINAPAPRPRRRGIAALVVVLLATSVVGGLILWRNATVKTPASAPTTTTGAANSQSTAGA